MVAIEIPPVPLEEAEKWLEINTFECPFGRVSPETCMKLRARPTLREWLKNGAHGKNPELRPECCEKCTQYKKLWKEVYEKRSKFYAKQKQKNKKEVTEMAEKKSQRKKGPKVQVNFSKYTDIYEMLKRQAEEECREVYQQIIWCIKQYLKVRKAIEEKQQEVSHGS